MLALYITSGCLGYILIGILVGKWNYNNLLNQYYAESLKEFKDRFSDDVQYRETALRHAKSMMKYRDAEFGSFMAGILWPIILPALVFLLVVKKMSNINFMQSKAEREVMNLKNTKALADARKKEWSLALHTMEEAGIDTRELRKMKIE
jgi:hypothetical protein